MFVRGLDKRWADRIGYAPCRRHGSGRWSRCAGCNRLRVIDALRAARADLPRRDRAADRAVAAPPSPSLVAELQADGLVVERAETARRARRRRAAGRRSCSRFDASAGAALGIDFGHRHLRVAVADLALERSSPSARVELDVDHAAEEALDAAAALVDEVARRGGRRPRRR